ERTWLLLITESVIVALLPVPVVLMPPPADVAWLWMMVLAATFSVPWLAMPPPALAELFLTVVPVTVVVPKAALSMPPALAVGELRLTVRLVGVVSAEGGGRKDNPLV